MRLPINRSIFATLLVIITISLRGSWALAGESIDLTLDQAIHLALRDNRTLRIQAAEITRLNAQLSQDQSRRLPTVTVAATQQYDRGYYSQDTFSTITQSSIRQYLYQGGAITQSWERTQAELQAAYAKDRRVKSDIVLSVTKNFCATLLAQAFTDLNQHILENTQQHQASLHSRYVVGQASENDLLQMDQALENVHRVYEESRNQIHVLSALLKNLLYLDEQVEIKVRGSLNYEPRDLLYDEGFLQALAKRPEIHEYAARELAQLKSVEIAKASGRPTIFASWDYYSRSHNLATARKDWNDHMVLGVTFSWPLFDGWGTKAKVDQAIADLQKTQWLKDQLLKDIQLQLRYAYVALQNAAVGLRVAETQLRWHEDSVKKVMAQFQKGIASQMDVADVTLSQTIAVFNKTQAIYDYLIAHADFAYATGGLQ